jgi:hypothetical protein
VRPRYKIDPSAISFRNVDRGLVVPFACRIHGEPHDSLVVERQPAGVTCQLVPEGAGIWMLKGELATSAVEQGTVLIARGKKGLVEIPFDVTLRSAFEVRPGEYVSLGRFDSKLGCSSIVEIREVERGAFGDSIAAEVVSWNKEDGCLHASYKDLERGSISVTIAVKPGISAGLVRGLVRVSTGNKDVGSIDLRVVGFAIR